MPDVGGGKCGVLSAECGGASEGSGSATCIRLASAGGLSPGPSPRKLRAEMGRTSGHMARTSLRSRRPLPLVTSRPPPKLLGEVVVTDTGGARRRGSRCAREGPSPRKLRAERGEIRGRVARTSLRLRAPSRSSPRDLPPNCWGRLMLPTQGGSATGIPLRPRRPSPDPFLGERGEFDRAPATLARHQPPPAVLGEVGE
jgi:hypothetical protein